MKSALGCLVHPGVREPDSCGGHSSHARPGNAKWKCFCLCGSELVWKFRWGLRRDGSCCHSGRSVRGHNPTIGWIPDRKLGNISISPQF